MTVSPKKISAKEDLDFDFDFEFFDVFIKSFIFSDLLEFSIIYWIILFNSALKF
jgi:hypothetical protein